MADIMQNPELRKKQIQLRIMELQVNLQRMDIRKTELDDEKIKIDMNVEATNKALEELKKELN